MTRLRPLALLLLILCPLAPVSWAWGQATRPSTRPADAEAEAEAAAELPTFDLWYAMLLGGQRAGHSHVTASLEDGRYITVSDSQLAIRRGPARLDIRTTSRFEETPEGKPLRATSSMKQSAMTIEQELVFADPPARPMLTTRQLDAEGNVTSESTREIEPVQGQWATPGQLARQWQRAAARDADAFEARTLDVSMGVKPFTLEAKRAAEAGDEVEVYGKAVPATAWDVAVSNLPGMTLRQWIDREGRPVKMSLPLMPGMEIDVLLADRATATADVEAPEVMAAMLLEPAEGSVAIKEPRESRTAVYTVRFGAGEATGEAEGEAADLPRLPRAGYQRVVWGDQQTAKVVVDLTSPVAPGDDLPGEEHLAASTMIDFKNPAIRKVLGELPPETARRTPARLAGDLRALVARYVNAKDLSVGMATASEVCRTRQGDCTEHAVLLAALLRANDIPSRTVTGVVYADQFLGRDGVFGFHMWTQAWLEGEGGEQGKGGRWVDLDPSLPPDGPAFDATHIALGTSAMADDDLNNEMIRLLPLMQGLTIKVEAMQ